MGKSSLIQPEWDLFIYYFNFIIKIKNICDYLINLYFGNGYKIRNYRAIRGQRFR